jgi:hypothetical protein
MGWKFEGKKDANDFPAEQLNIGELAVITSVPEVAQAHIKVGELVIHGSLELIFPQKSLWGKTERGYRVCRLRDDERVIFTS